MASCEMCGKVAELAEADVEGVSLKLCPGCLKYGTVRKRFDGGGSSGYKRDFSRPQEQEFKIVDNYASLIRGAREYKGWSQEEFAKFLNERESIVAKWENGVLKPFIDVARMLERKLGIVLVVKDENAEQVKVDQKGKSDELTLGDFIKVKKR